MKKFEWRLQRLLDIKIKQEEALRSELVTLTEKAVSVRGAILQLKLSVQERLEQLGELNGAERIAEQAFFMRYADSIRYKIEEMKQNLAELERKRQEKIKEILDLRKRRKSLEQLRENSYMEYLEEVKKYEQNQLDDRNCVRYARMALSEDMASDRKESLAIMETKTGE